MVIWAFIWRHAAAIVAKQGARHRLLSRLADRSVNDITRCLQADAAREPSNYILHFRREGAHLHSDQGGECIFPLARTGSIRCAADVLPPVQVALCLLNKRA